MSLLNHLESKTSNNDKNHLFSNMNGNLNNNKNDNKITMTDTDNISLLSKADIELMDLIKDFFNFQFKMKNAPCPFPSTKENNLKINNNDNNLITTNDNYNHILISLEKMGKLFAEQYHDKLYGMIKKLKLKSNNTNNCAMFHCLSNEIFANGIQWNYIITYFVFSSYFAYYGQQQRVISAEEVAKWLFSYISENLYSWIKNNGNWEGLIKFANETVGPVEMDNDNNGTMFNVGLKNLITGAAGAIGILSLGLLYCSNK